MNSVRVTSDNIRWPHKCAMCNDIAEKQVTASCSVLRGALPIPFFGILLSSRRITYPVCKRHRLRAWFAAGLSERNLFYLGLGFLSIYCLIFTVGKVFDLIVTGTHHEFWGFDIFAVAFAACYWFLYFWAKKNTPIRIAGFKDGTLQFEFNNQQFANDFQVMNSNAS
jgi:hypothetical protein